MKRYRKKPVTIEAVKWAGDNISEICKFTGRDVAHLLVEGQLYIQTLEGVHHASVGDYIIKGVRGEFYPCKPDIFHETYREVYESGGIDCMYATFEEMNSKIDRINGVMKIVGDDYDLGRLRELSRADQAIGREIFLPNDKVRGTVEGFRAWKDGSISFMLVDGRHRYSLSSDLVYKFLVGRKEDE